MSIGPGSQTSLREANAARVIETVRKYGKLTQVELTATTGLSPASISNIVKRLVAEGALEVESTIRSGRRAQLVSLVRKSGLIAGVQIGRRGLTVALADLDLEVHERISLPLPASHRSDTTLDRAAVLVAELLERMGSQPEKLASVGVTVPAPVDPDTGLISMSGMLPGWEDIDVARVLSKRLGRPVTIDNDANGALLAEARIGALRGVSDGMLLRVSHATGAAVLVGGAIHRGNGGKGGEIGHVQVEPLGLICQCGGRGCLNTVVGADVLVESLRLSRGELLLSDVIALALADDAGCRQVISDAGVRIGAVLADFAVVMQPTKIVVSGELAQTGDLLMAPIRDALESRPMLGNGIQLEAASLGADAELYGALLLALKEAEEAGSVGAASGESSYAVQSGSDQ